MNAWNVNFLAFRFEHIELYCSTTQFAFATMTIELNHTTQQRTSNRCSHEKATKELYSIFYLTVKNIRSKILPVIPLNKFDCFCLYWCLFVSVLCEPTNLHWLIFHFALES